VNNRRKEAGTAAAAAAAGDGAARSLHGQSLDFTRNSQRFQEKKAGLLQSQGEGRITEGSRSGEVQPGKGRRGEAVVAPPVTVLVRLAVATTEDHHHGRLVFFPSADPSAS